MGTTYGEWVEYRCFDDCHLNGCPGHKVRVNLNRTSDIWEIEREDGSIRHYDENALKAIVKAYQIAQGVE